MIHLKQRVTLLRPEYDGDEITEYQNIGNVWAQIESVNARSGSEFMKQHQQEFLAKPLLTIRLHRKVSIDSDYRLSFREQTYVLISQPLDPIGDYQSYLITPLEEAEE